MIMLDEPLLLSGQIQQTTNCIFFLFFQKTECDISGKLSPLESVCMKYQVLLPGKNKKKYFKMMSAEKVTHGVDWLPSN